MVVDSKPPTEGQDHGVEFDELTQQRTTGHVWDGIRELDRPLPRWWLIVFLACIAFAAVYVVFYPAIPLVHSATPGVLDYSSRRDVDAAVQAGRRAQSANLQRIAALPLADIRANEELARFAVQGGRSAFAVNCSPCHGSGAAGSKGYPNLNDDDWLWGGTLATIEQTITHGVRFAADPATRNSVMPSFGADGLLSPIEIASVAETVLAISGQPHDAALAKTGEKIFADNCAVCHGAKGAGNREFGAPALTDKIWLYGNDRAAIVAQVTRPKLGIMPAWGARLDPVTVKELALYVHSLGGGETEPAKVATSR